VKKVESEAARSVRVAHIAAGLGTVGLVIKAFIGTPGGPSTIQVLSIVICALLWLWLLITRRPHTVAFGSAMFLVLNTTICVALWSDTQQTADTGISFVPFRANQLGALAIALMAPPVPWVGVVAILTVIGSAVVQFAMFSDAVRELLPYGDPLSTLFFGGFAIVLLFYRLSADRNQREVVRAQAEAESYQRYARAMLAIRDLSNTPLQTLMNITAVMRQRGDHIETVQRLERTVARMTELEQLLRPFEEHLDWRPGDEGWDPKAILRLSAANN
jgi:hypothetical protein